MVSKHISELNNTKNKTCEYEEINDTVDSIIIYFQNINNIIRSLMNPDIQ